MTGDGNDGNSSLNKKMDFDVIVVGTGAAGLSAALSAQASGARVLVL